MPKQILIPIPSTDFDPTECAVPWKLLKDRGMQVQFATPSGERAKCDRRMINGNCLGPLAPFLIADKNGRRAYAELEQDDRFSQPLSWSQLSHHDFDGLILPGGHAPGMREYLESRKLQEVVAEFFENEKPVGAICHGVVLAARSSLNGASVLHGRKTTCLLWTQEMMAWGMTALWLGSYYRTYKQTVEAEVKSNLNSLDDFISGPAPLLRDSLEHVHRGFVVRDGNYISARWPGDSHRFAMEFLDAVG